MSDLVLFDDPVMAHELGQTLRHRREAAGLSREALAARVDGLTKETVNAWEQGKNLLHVEAYFQALEALDCRVRIYKRPLTRQITA